MTKNFSSCTILRTFKRTSYNLSLASGRKTNKKIEWVTEPCNTPLFGDVDCETGICRSCAQGWSVKGSTFAVEKKTEEGRRALTEGVRRGYHDPTSRKFANLMFRIAGNMVDAKAALKAQKSKK